MTRDEATHKLCPHIINTANPNTGDQYHSFCHADYCMAWRWGLTKGQVEGSFVHKELPPEQWKGFCGLAGKPVL